MTKASELLKQARNSRQLTMTIMADIAGVSASTISRIEAGKVEPTWAMMNRLLSAVGFRCDQTLVESGSDQPLADVLDRLERAKDDERAEVLAQFPVTASMSTIVGRNGMRRAAVPGSLVAAVQLLTDQGQNPVVSGMEAAADLIDPVRSFIPIVYVDDPRNVTGFDPAGKHACQVMAILPATDNVRRWTREDLGIPMVTHEWAWLDAMASPGRQGDIAREWFDSMKLVFP